jgi:TatD DNase family protein
MQFIDTHAHLTNEAYDNKELDAILDRARQAGVDNWITVGTDIDDSAAAVELTHRYEQLYCAVGVHPHESGKQISGYLEQLQLLARNDNVVAVGEIGLDYHYDFSPRNIQQKIFQEQLILTRQLQLPVVIHCREALDHCLGILDDWDGDETPVVFHCFGGDKKTAKNLLDRGYYLSLTGTITFNNATELQQVVKYIPLEKIMLETDCPFLSPHPKRNIKPNEPALLIHTAEKLARLLDIDIMEIAQATGKNSRYFFRLQ